MRGRMEFYHYFPSVTFLLLTADQFVWLDDGPLEPEPLEQKPPLSKKTHIFSDFKTKSESSLQRRQGIFKS